ncbi:MAG: ABC transporter permease [Alicyclobacillus sp.]|nr:ABC transporter permease [Alicyclobacillus sp.]
MQSRRWTLITLAVFIVEMAVFSLVTPNFFNFSNLMTMTENFMVVGIMALAQAFVIIGGGIDLSVGSTMSLSGVMMAVFWQHGVNIWIACVLAVLVGGVAGWINGQLIVRTGIQPLIATLSTLFIYGSLALVIGGQGSIYQFPQSYLYLGTGLLFGRVPLQLVIFVVLAVGFGFLLQKTNYGRFVIFIGNNENGAKYSGIPVNRVKTWTYTVSGLMAGVSAVILGSYFASVRGDMGQNFELQVITACLVGGVNVFGGSGTISGTVLGTLILGMLGQGLYLQNVSSVEQSIVTGVVLILAVGIQQLSVYVSRRRRPISAAERGVQGDAWHATVK